MASLVDLILEALKDLNDDEFGDFKFYLQQPENTAGEALTESVLEKCVRRMDLVKKITQKYSGKERDIMRTVLTKMDRSDLAGRFGNTGGASGRPAVPRGSTNRGDYLKHSSPLSWDPNTVHEKLILSENCRKATWTRQDQPYADHPQRFTRHYNVLSSESLSDPCYFEVEWSGEQVEIAVSYKDINRKEKGLSSFSQSDMSWALQCVGSVGAERYWFFHNNIHTAVSGPRPSTGRDRVGVFVNQTEGCLCFYHLDGADKMSLIHRETTSFVRGPLYAGIGHRAGRATAEVSTAVSHSETAAYGGF